jgi:iron complex outermembrane receptor protein
MTTPTSDGLGWRNPAEWTIARKDMCTSVRQFVHRRVVAGIGVLLLSMAATDLSAQILANPSQPALTQLSLQELANVEVTTASRQSRKVSETPSAIQVITGEDIHRSGATNLAEALRLASNLRVAQVNAHAWVVSARGFSGIFTNKLLVMIDGRTVYTPLFAGVLWDVQNPPLEDIDRIEIVSGPGGTLWGSNAVNGVINVITRRAEDTQGLYASVTGGSMLHGGAAVRYGRALRPGLFVRAYAERTDRDATQMPNGKDSPDAWHVAQGGFRMDWRWSEADSVTLQGDVYSGTEDTTPTPSVLDGENLLGAWTRKFSETSDLKLQLYVDRTYRRDTPSTIHDELITTDVDFQHRFAAGGRNGIIWGGGYRLMKDDTPPGSPFVGFAPRQKTMPLFSAFAQDDVAVIPERVTLTLGTKLEHNVYSGFEVQPSVRMAWTPTSRHTVWSAVSRAVRSPSRIDVDYHIPPMVIAIGSPGVNGGPEFVSENVLAYEVGYHVEPAASLSLSVATFYNRYSDLYSVESVNGSPTYEIENGTTGRSSGLEVSETYQPTGWWRLRGGYTYFYKKLANKPGHTYDFSPLGNDPTHQLALQSILNFPRGVQLDVMPRLVSALPSPAIARYATFDLRLAWTASGVELSLMGQNLGDVRHAEFTTQKIGRSVFARMAWRP